MLVFGANLVEVFLKVPRLFEEFDVGETRPRFLADFTVFSCGFVGSYLFTGLLLATVLTLTVGDLIRLGSTCSFPGFSFYFYFSKAVELLLPTTTPDPL